MSKALASLLIVSWVPAWVLPTASGRVALDQYAAAPRWSWRDAGFVQSFEVVGDRTLAVTDHQRDEQAGLWSIHAHQAQATFRLSGVASGAADLFCGWGRTQTGDHVVQLWRLEPFSGEVSKAPFVDAGGRITVPRKVFLRDELYRGPLTSSDALLIGGDLDERGRFFLGLVQDGPETLLCRFDMGYFPLRSDMIFVDPDDDGRFEAPPLVEGSGAPELWRTPEDWDSLKGPGVR